MNTEIKVDWSQARTRLVSLTEEDQKIVDMLVDRKTQPEIAQALGQHRSMVWRKVQRLKKRLQVAKS
jgi:uncharacterized membrane protein